jgi:hypothetical protein
MGACGAGGCGAGGGGVGAGVGVGGGADATTGAGWLTMVDRGNEIEIVTLVVVGAE